MNCMAVYLCGAIGNIWPCRPHHSGLAGKKRGGGGGGGEREMRGKGGTLEYKRGRMRGGRWKDDIGWG